MTPDSAAPDTGDKGAPPSLLAARDAGRKFGSFTALDSVDFDVRSGEVHALLGENGAGKSTLMNILSGLLRPTSGEILLDGTPVRFASARDAERAGIGMVHQHFLLVPTLSVLENLMLGASPEMGGALSYPSGRVLDEAKNVAERLGWRIPWDSLAGTLPVGTQQRVEILKALRGRTRVLIFDEPTAVLTPAETPELFATIRQLASEGRGLVFISHKLDEVLELAGRITVLRRGKVVHRTVASETTAAKLGEAMVGREMVPVGPSPPVPLPQAVGEGEPEGTARRSEPAGGGVASDSPSPTAWGKGTGGGGLSVTNLTLTSRSRTLLDNISFDVAPGEIFGIAGVDGNGQTELAECLSGLRGLDSGSIRIGNEYPEPNPLAFRRAGVAVIPADRQVRGLALPMSLTENLAFGVYDDPKYRRGPFLLWPALRQRAAELIERFDIRATGPEAAAQSLSGGNQQKVVIARALSGDPRVVVAVNPTRGLDVGAIAYVHAALRSAQVSGAAIVLISTELDEVLALATSRVAVLYEGRFSGVVSPATPREDFGLLMGGGQRPDAAGAGV